MSLAVLIAMTIGCIAWSWDPARDMDMPLGGCGHSQHCPAGRRCTSDVPVGVGDHRSNAFRADRKVEPRGLPGHDCYIVAASAIVYNALGRLQNDDAMQASFKQYVERPATLCIPLLLATFSVGNGAAIYRPDFFDVPTDFWLSAYWLLLCGTLIYLLGYGSRALLILRKDPRSRRIANVYLIACAFGILACVVRITTAYVTPIQALEGGNLVWLFACMCGAGFGHGIGSLVANQDEVVLPSESLSSAFETRGMR